MRERVESLIGSTASGVWLSTFHSLCARLLRREAPKIGLSRDFVIYDSSDQVAVVKQTQRELGIDDKLVPPRMALGRISQAKNRMEGPETLRGGWNIREEQIARIYERYLQALKDANALDFDDLLLKTVELFETSQQVREFYARKFKYVMVDEYQDTNRPQYMLIRRLAEVHRNIAVVGDPDQSIYNGAVPTSVTFSTSSTISPMPASSDSSRTIDRPKRSWTPRPPSSGRTAIARTSVCGPIEPVVRRLSISGATTNWKKPTSSPARSSNIGLKMSTR